LHLLQHLADALDQVFSAHGPALKAVRDAQRGLPVTQADGRTAVSVPPRTPTPQAQTRAAQRRARRLATSVQVWTRHREGWSHRVIAQHLGRGRMTVVRSLQAPTVPERNGAVARGVPGGPATLSGHPTPRRPGERPHRGA